MKESKHSTIVCTDTKILVYNSLILSILLYGRKTWKLKEGLERRITAFEHKAYKRNLGITYRKRKRNYYVYQLIVDCICKVEHLQSKLMRRKMSYIGHTMRYYCLNKTVIQGYVFGKRKSGRTRKKWMDNIVEWAGVINGSDPTTRGYTEP